MTGATALLLVLAADDVARWLAAPEALLRYSGVLLIPFALYVGFLSRRDVVPRTNVMAA